MTTPKLTDRLPEPQTPVSPVWLTPLAIFESNGAHALRIAELRSSEARSPKILEAKPAARLSAKCIWLNPTHLTDKISILYANAVVVANPSREQLERLEAGLTQAKIPVKMLGKRKVILLNTIRSIKADKNRKDINIRHKKNGKAYFTNISFASRDARNEFFEALQKKLGPNFERTVKEYKPFEAVGAPVLTIGLIIFSAYLCHAAALEAAAGVGSQMGGRRQLLKLLFAAFTTLIGPTGALILGVILTALALFWLFARMLQPPIIITLAPTIHSTKSSTRPTGLKA
jgi:hypothetical protein